LHAAYLLQIVSCHSATAEVRLTGDSPYQTGVGGAGFRSGVGGGSPPRDKDTKARITGRKQHPPGRSTVRPFAPPRVAKSRPESTDPNTPLSHDLICRPLESYLPNSGRKTKSFRSESAQTVTLNTQPLHGQTYLRPMGHLTSVCREATLYRWGVNRASTAAATHRMETPVRTRLASPDAANPRGNA